MTLPYRTLFLCTLVQESAFTTGGRIDTPSLTDLGLARDGQGKPVIRGSTLAGALIATARTFTEVPEAISRPGRLTKEADAQPLSLWRFDHAFLPNGDDQTELRAHVALRQDTRTAHEGGYFDLEALGPGRRWRFLLEVAGSEDCPEAATIAALALREWQWGRCWLGRRIARGLGWMRLTGCTVVELPRTKAAIDAWPNATLDSLASRHVYVETLGQDLGTSWADLASYLAAKGESLPPRPRRAYVRWPLQIRLGEYRPTPDGPSYGLDALSPQGHGSQLFSAEPLKEHLLRRPEQAWKAFQDAFSPDATLPLTWRDGHWEPVIPGSAIAGAWRHALSHSERRQGQAVRDPATGDTYGQSLQGDDPVAALFGSLDSHPSRLLIRDAYPHDDTWQVTLLDKVALDEFRQSAYPGAKYNRLALLAGTWGFEMVQEIRLDDGATLDGQRLTQLTEPVRRLLQEAARRRIGLGGGEFRSYGHVAIEARAPAQWALAGEPWRTFEEEDTR